MALRIITCFLFLTVNCFSNIALAKEDLISSPLAEAFGKQPFMKKVRISPDGSKIVYIKQHDSGLSYAEVYDFVTKKPAVVLSGKKNDFDLTQCLWANSSRLLCTAFFVEPYNGSYIPWTRLVGVDADGSNIKVLLKRKNRKKLSQFQGNIVDWLVDDPDHVLIQLSENNSVSVQKLNIYSGVSKTEQFGRSDIRSWISDGSGNLRAYKKVSKSEFSWYAKSSKAEEWEKIKSHSQKDGFPSFRLAGFGENLNQLYYFDNYQGKNALYVMDLSKSPIQTTKVYARNDVDLSNAFSMGRDNRIVGVSYALDHVYRYFFDESLAEVHQILQQVFSDKVVTIVDEDWAKSRYIVHVGSDSDAGEYYLFDRKKKQALKLSRLFRDLSEIELVSMQPISYTAKDNTLIPAYLTLPNKSKAPYPTIVLPHGGPSSRDIIQFDYLVQYLVAKGYAVLQSNYRGSSGFGGDWEGDGAFKGWRQAVSDVLDGADYLIKEEVSDRERICIVGWSYGGYAALMSVIEDNVKFQCVASIAGVTDPKDLASFKQQFVAGRAVKEFIGASDKEVTQNGSPLKRVDEIKQPVFLAHPRKDYNVPARQSRKLAKKLKRAKKEVEYIEYKNTAHSIASQPYRIDLLTRLGDFLDKHIGK